MEEAFGSSDGGPSSRHHPFETLGDGLEEAHDTEGGRGVVGDLAGYMQDHPIGGLEGGGVVTQGYQRIVESECYNPLLSG